MTRLSKLLLICVIMFFAACTDSYVYNGYVSIPQQKWHADSVVSFTVPITDTLSYFNLFVNLRNTSDYPYQNLYLFIDIAAPNGAAIRDTFECYLADEHGKWLGKGRHGLYDNRFMYREKVRFGTTGDYRVSLQQGMRTDELKGISEVGFRVELATTK